MAKTRVEFGVTLCAYASDDIEIPEGASAEQAIQIIREHYDREDLVFQPEWDSRFAHRIVGCYDNPELSAAIQDTPIDPPLLVDQGSGDLEDIMQLVARSAQHCGSSTGPTLELVLRKLQTLHAMHGNLKPDKALRPTQEGIEVRHPGCYGIDGTRNTHQISIDDQRLTSGQILVDIGCIDGMPDDLLCVTAEVGTHPENSVEQLPCVHVNFDADNLALSIFKSGDALIVRMEEGVSLTPLRSEGCFILR